MHESEKKFKNCKNIVNNDENGRSNLVTLDQDGNMKENNMQENLINGNIVSVLLSKNVWAMTNGNENYGLVIIHLLKEFEYENSFLVCLLTKVIFKKCQFRPLLLYKNYNLKTSVTVYNCNSEWEIVNGVVKLFPENF